jgi:hypothetical protein
MPGLTNGGFTGRIKPRITCLSFPPGIWDEQIQRFKTGILVDYSTPERAVQVMVNLNGGRTLIK